MPGWKRISAGCYHRGSTEIKRERDEWVMRSFQVCGGGFLSSDAIHKFPTLKEARDFVSFVEGPHPAPGFPKRLNMIATTT